MPYDTQVVLIRKENVSISAKQETEACVFHLNWAGHEWEHIYVQTHICLYDRETKTQNVRERQRYWSRSLSPSFYLFPSLVFIHTYTNTFNWHCLVVGENFLWACVCVWRFHLNQERDNRRQPSDMKHRGSVTADRMFPFTLCVTFKTRLPYYSPTHTNLKQETSNSSYSTKLPIPDALHGIYKSIWTPIHLNTFGPKLSVMVWAEPLSFSERKSWC